MISYEPLWITLKKKGVTQYQLINKYHISAGQLSRLRANANVSTHTLNTLCEILDCKLEDIAIYRKEDWNVWVKRGILQRPKLVKLDTSFFHVFPDPILIMQKHLETLWNTLQRKKTKIAVSPEKSRFTAIFLWAGDERIELPPKVLET